MPAKSAPPIADTPADYDRSAILDPNGPLHPGFMTECVRALMRALPLDASEPEEWANRRIHAAMLALTALHPRDEIEVMLAVQAISAYHAACACWYLGMNRQQPAGDSTRHLAAAASAARTFDTMLKALERRAGRPLAVPPGRPPNREWPREDLSAFAGALAARAAAEAPPAAPPDRAPPHWAPPHWAPPHWAPPDRVLADRALADRVLADRVLADWTPEALAQAAAMQKRERAEEETAGLDIAGTEGILPGGGIVVPEDPTPNQAAYIGRRLGLAYRREYEENLRRGVRVLPRLRQVRPGDFVP
jgi:hypothetical protein